MIAIVRMKAQERAEGLWDNIVRHVEELQGRLQQQGRLLYLSRRAKHEDVSLFVHVTAPDVLGSLIADDLSKIEEVTDCWVINMLKPVFFPLPRDTSMMKRYVITLKVFPSNLASTYEDLLQPNLPPGNLMAYLALTCHLYGDSIQFSVLSEDDEQMDGFIDEKVRTMPGVLHATVNWVERTRPLVSYDEWKEYSDRHSLVQTWDDRFMINQFGNSS